jgi:hypothetical protein
MPLCNGVGIYCDPCDIAIDRWTGGRRLRPDGLPQRCPDHLNPCRLAEVNERNLEELEEEFKAKRDRPAGAAVEALLSYLPIDTMPELPRLLKLLALLEETLVGLDKTT